MTHQLHLIGSKKKDCKKGIEFSRSTDTASKVGRYRGEGELADSNRSTIVGSEARGPDPAAAGANGEEIKIIVLRFPHGPVVAARAGARGDATAKEMGRRRRRAQACGKRKIRAEGFRGEEKGGAGKPSGEGLESGGREGELRRGSEGGSHG